MADVKISELGSAAIIADSDYLVVDTGSATLKATGALVKEYIIGDNNISGIGDGSATGAISTLNSGKAPKSDLAPISITGSTNNTGNTIYDGTYFYKDGALVIAIADIANGATLTSNTNYSTVTAGALNLLAEQLKRKAYRYQTTDADSNVTYLECNVLKQGRVVYITGSWQGNNTNAESLLTLPSELRPSSVVRGTGGAYVPTNPTITTQFGVYNLATDGKITQSSDTRKASQGNFVFIYVV